MPINKTSKAKAIKAATSDKPAANVAPAETAKAEKPVAFMHGFKAAYSGASQPIRAHGKNLSPVVLDRVPNKFTERDHAMLKALHGNYGTKAFQRGDADAGAVSRLIGHGYVKHVSGNLDARDCTFSLTAKAISERFKTA